jgi:molybdate transport system substrate-binding protein
LRPTSPGPAKEIAALFKEKPGHEAILSFGASGNFFTQISHDAPFQVFLSADAERPKVAVEQGYGVRGSDFAYAIGRLILWSKVIDVTKGDEALGRRVLEPGDSRSDRRALRAAAIETMKKLRAGD